MGVLCFAPKDVEESPPVRVGSKRMAWVLVQAFVELVVQQVAHEGYYYEQRPVGLEDWKQLAREHVEFSRGSSGKRGIYEERVRGSSQG